MKLITEVNYEPMSILTEVDSSGNKFLKIVGPMAVAEQKNKNGRIYPRAVLESAVDKYVNDYVKTNRSPGEMNHPPRLTLDYERATHMVTKLTPDGNTWIGEAKVLTTPMGQVLKGLLESGVAIGVSTRGAGSITESGGIKTVGDDFFLTAIDAVSDPSGPGCFVNGIMEGYEYELDSTGKIIQQNIAETAKKDYDKKRLTEARKLELFNSFISQVSKLGRD